MKIKLTKGKFTNVDAEDYERLSKNRWCASQSSKRLFYAVRGVWKNGKTKRVFMAREIMNFPEGMEIDHINGDTLDNRKSNLRVCSHQQNAFNRDKNINNSSGFKGVTKNHGKWIAQIKVNFERICLGAYETKEKAYDAYKIAEKKHFGNFAKKEQKFSL